LEAVEIEHNDAHNSQGNSSIR